MSDFLRPHDCSTPGFPVHYQLLELAQTNVHWLSQWCHLTVSCSVVPFSRLQSFLASGSFQMSQFFTSGGQSIGVAVSVLPINIQNWFPLGLSDLISLKSKGLSGVFSNTTIQKYQFFGTQLSLRSSSHITYDYWENHSFDYCRCANHSISQAVDWIFYFQMFHSDFCESGFFIQRPCFPEIPICLWFFLH